MTTGKWPKRASSLVMSPMGYAAEVGKNVKGFAVGDRVSGLWGGSLPGSGGMVEYGVATPGKDVVAKLPDCLSDEEAILGPSPASPARSAR